MTSQSSEQHIGRKGRTSNPPARAMHPVTLRFVDPALERHYHDARLQYRHNAGRVSALAGVIAWLIFAILDSTSIRDPSLSLFYLRLFGAGALLVLFVVLLVAKPGRWIESLGVATLVANIVLFVLAMASMTAVSLPYFSPPAIFTMAAVMSFALAGMTFIEGVAIASLAFAGFLFSVTVLWPEPRLAVIYQFTWMLTITAFAAIGFYFLDRTQRIAWLRQIDLIGAQDQIRTLLHNVLPPSIAERKLAGESPIADSFQQASLLFADVVGFTRLSSGFSSAQVVDMLNELFDRFDRVVDRYGLEKIKTIGDCYMVAGGLPEPNPEHLERLTRAALDMQTEASQVRAPDGSTLALRIGMHTGPVTAGVIGRAKFAFDVWGDTVNTASRMEAQGTANQIRVTDEVRNALAESYVFEGPEIVDVKGKGPTRVWTLIAGRSGEDRDE
jgi:class 3 adenylate cyclase